MVVERPFWQGRKGPWGRHNREDGEAGEGDVELQLVNDYGEDRIGEALVIKVKYMC